MVFVSTRGGSPEVTFSEAMERGLAPDGGLYVPESLPSFAWEQFTDTGNIPELAARMLQPFFVGDALERDLADICHAAFSFPLPVVTIEESPPRNGLGPTAVLELYHGPTAAFKDVGASFIAQCLGRCDKATGSAESDARILLVATSGDTGGAVAAAFHRKQGIDVAILFPLGGVSPRQEKQLTAWGDNVHAFAVRGSFDDCQRLLKDALGDASWRSARRLTTANSINIARLLPQTLYYAAAAIDYRRAHGVNPGFVVPAGNLGNAVGAMWAKAMGFPLGKIVLAANANRTIPDYFSTGRWTPRASVKTLANAMDVGDPSNMERVFALYEDREVLREEVNAVSVSDKTIERVIAEGPERWSRIWDPHTATAVQVRELMPSPHWIIVATAHPAKFPEVVDRLVGKEVEVPPALAAILRRPSQFEELDASLSQLKEALGR